MMMILLLALFEFLNAFAHHVYLGICTSQQVILETLFGRENPMTVNARILLIRKRHD